MAQALMTAAPMTGAGFGSGTTVSGTGSCTGSGSGSGTGIGCGSGASSNRTRSTRRGSSPDSGTGFGSCSHSHSAGSATGSTVDLHPLHSSPPRPRPISHSSYHPILPPPLRHVHNNSYHFRHHPQHVYLKPLITNTTNYTAGSIQQPSHNKDISPNHPAGPRPCVHSFYTMPIVDNVHNETIPDSPPDLTESKSSKSSGSLRSSCLTDAVGQENFSHFEEIALADSGRDSDELQTHHVTKRQGEKRSLQNRRPSAPSVSGGRRRGTASSDQMLRDSTNIMRPQSSHQKPNGGRGTSPRPGTETGMASVMRASQPLAVPSRKPPRRQFTSPSSPALSSMSHRVTRESRSASPNGHLSSASRSPRSSLSASSSYNGSFRSPGLSRKQSWQPGRKTVKELEEEYHDSDEEVPEDAVIWNVPISPRPPIGASRSTPQSRRNSSQGNLSPSLPQTVPNKHDSVSNSSPRPGMPPHSATVGSFPADALAPRTRTKSWTADLSAEARELSAALEEHAERESNEKHRSVVTIDSAASSPPRPTPKLRTKTSIMELPPVQKGNIMIDPLPISKEKEAVLTRTRPSWLPPKDPKEERRHLKQWEQMMAKAAEAERRREAKVAEQRVVRKKTTASIARIWEQHVLPNWDVVIREPRTRELWWRGVTPRDRGTVWARAIGNELSLTAASYEAALARARALRGVISDLPEEERTKHEDYGWISAIDRDVPTVFPELGIFGQDAPLHETLTAVLLAYSAYRSDVGYVYGTHLVAGLLVLNLPAPEAFIALANLLNRPTALAFLVEDPAGIVKAHELVLACLRYKIPRLYEHLTKPETGFERGATEWLTPFLQTLGAVHLSPEAASRVWDVAVFEGDKTFVRAAVGVLSLLESKLYGGRDEILQLLGWGAKRWDFGEEEVMLAMREAGKTLRVEERGRVAGFV